MHTVWVARRAGCAADERGLRGGAQGAPQKHDSATQEQFGLIAMRREHKQAARRAQGARWASGVYLFDLPVYDSALLPCPLLNSNRLCLYEMNRKTAARRAQGARWAA